MELTLTVAANKAGGTVQVSEVSFAREFNEPLVHQVVTAYLSAARQGTVAQKSRAQVSGSGKKPWRQKGTGRARAGSIRSPLWRGGGRTFAAVPQDHSQKVNKKMYRGAMRCIASELIRQERLVVVEGVHLQAPKTRELAGKLAELGLTRVLIVTQHVEENLYLAARNLPHVEVCDVHAIDPVSLIAYEKVLMTVGALKEFEEKLA